ncbi:MAG: hypothetical protein WBX38_20530 [Candidatus Sulfotelmatobacter sp.]
MAERKQDRLWELCEQAADEPDPSRVVALAAEINRLLETKEKDPKAGESSAA